MIIGELTEYLESIAPLHLQESYDNAGLIVGGKSTAISAVLTTLDATEEVIEEAIAKGCNLVVAHHPIIFAGVKQISKDHYIGRALIKAIENNIAIYAIHTNLDNVLEDGVNQRIAEKIGMVDVQILMAKDPHRHDIGSGAIGQLAEQMSMDDFLEHLKTTLNLEMIKHTPYVSTMVQRIALCGGSGRFLLEKAIIAQADVYISADFKYHEYFEANNQICIIDIGHYESERFTKNLLQELIQRKFSNFAAYCSEVSTNPINYR